MKITPRLILQLLFFVILLPFLPLLISGHWDWWEAWLYAAVSILGFIISRLLAARRNPDIISERGRMLDHEDTKDFDKKLAPLLGLGGLLIMVVPGLEARLGPLMIFSLPLKAIMLLLIVAGYSLGAYALVENRFFSGVVRIQTERGHQVVSRGPYRWMRHPGYAGAILTYLATPFFLDSVWTLLPAIFTVAILVIRTALEDRILQDELHGYREYTGKVRFRLLPGLW